MLYEQKQHKRRRAALAIVLIVLFSLQSVVSATELGALDLHSPEILDQRCADNFIDEGHETSEEDIAHCDDCGNCLGCLLTATSHNLTTYPVFESRTRFFYLACLTKVYPGNIDRPPIA